MSTITIHNQNLLDVAIQEHGSVLSVIDIAYVNGVSITEALQVGRTLSIENSTYTDSDIQGYYRRKSIQPATSDSGLYESNLPSGIGNMQIESTTNTFIVG